MRPAYWLRLRDSALALPRRVALLRVVRVHRLGETPVLEELDFDGSEVPTRDALERLGPRVKDPITFMQPLASDTRLTAFVNQRIDWQHAGFSEGTDDWGSPRRRAGGVAKHRHLVGRARRTLPSSSGAGSGLTTLHQLVNNPPLCGFGPSKIRVRSGIWRSH
jgi:hypothetical protein